MKRLLPILCLLLFPATAPRLAPAQILSGRPTPVTGSRATSPDNLIVPFRRIGAVRLGMGMDEVRAMLGNPSGRIRADNISGGTWYYEALNLTVNFDRGAAPIVTSVSTIGWGRKSKKLGNLFWKDIQPVKVNFQTAEGIGIGASAFDVRRAYSNYGYQDEAGLFMRYESLGLTFSVTVDHVIYAIGIYTPR